MENALIYILFFIGILLIVKGGDLFVDAAAAMAKAFHVPPFLIGATIVSLATTLPEMLVSVMAAAEGRNDMAIGNAVGSVTANTGLILGISLLILPGVAERKDYLKKSLLLIIAVAGLWLLCREGSLGMAGSLFMILLFVLFLAENIYSAKKNAGSTGEEAEEKQDIKKTLLFFVIGTAGIIVGSDLLVDKGCQIAVLWGVPEQLIALTMVAIGTSLPELVTTITALVKREGSLSVGNIIGANIIDTSLILPLCSFVSGGNLPVSAQASRLDMPVCLGIVLVALLPMIIREKFHRLQGVICLAAYGVYIIYICVALS